MPYDPRWEADFEGEAGRYRALPWDAAGRTCSAHRFDGDPRHDRESADRHDGARPRSGRCNDHRPSAKVARLHRETARPRRVAGDMRSRADGMCFTGNFARTMTLEPQVTAPVLSQPSLPLDDPAGLEISDADQLDTAAIRAGRPARSRLLVRQMTSGVQGSDSQPTRSCSANASAAAYCHERRQIHNPRRSSVTQSRLRTPSSRPISSTPRSTPPLRHATRSSCAFAMLS